MTTKKRISKHQLKEDQFVTGVFRLQEWAEENLNIVLIAAGALVVVIAAIWFFASQGAQSKQEAMELLGRADMQARNGQTQLAIIDYQKILDDHSGSDAARVAAFKLANVYFDTNDYANAQAAFRQYLENYADNDLARFSAIRGLAMTSASQGDFQQAARHYWDLGLRDTISGFGNDYLFKAVNYAIKADDTALAEEAFAELQETAPNTEEFRLAKIMMIENGYLTYQEGQYR